MAKDQYSPDNGYQPDDEDEKEEDRTSILSPTPRPGSGSLVPWGRKSKE